MKRFADIFSLDAMEVQSPLENLNEWTEETLKFGYWTYEISSGRTWWSKGVYAIYGLNPDSVQTDPVISFYSDASKKQLEQSMNIAITQDEPWSHTLKLVDASGTEKWVRSSGYPKVENGRKYICGIMQEVTSEQVESGFVESLVNQIPSQIVMADADNLIQFSNDRDIIGSQHDVIGKDICQFFPLEERSKINNCMTAARKCELPLSTKVTFVEPLFDEERIIDTVISPVFIEDDFKGYIFLLTDVTEEVKQEKDIEHQQAIAQQNARLAAIGELAAGVGHEINNPLAIIRTTIEAVEFQVNNGRDSQLGGQLDSYFSKVKGAIDRVSEIVNGLRTFSRAEDEHQEIVDLGQVARNTITFVKEMFAKDEVEIILDLSESPVCVEGNIGKLQQVFLNLIMNARDAVVESTERIIVVKTEHNGLQARLLVSDSGPGIPDKNKAEIFKAFYTTKAVNKGTGMGLYISDSIVRRMGGRIRVTDSELGGACFRLEMPYKDAQLSMIAQNSIVDVAAEENLNCQRILLVDDEADIRDILAETLRHYGHSVTTAMNGVEALNAMDTATFDVVVSDIKMPKMNGIALFAEIKERLKEQRPILIFMTGANEKPANGLSDVTLLKPFSAVELQEAMQKLLQEKLMIAC